ALEQCLVGLQERGAPLPGAALPVLARTIAGLRSLTGRVQARQAFTGNDEREAAEIGSELETLRHEVTPETAFDDSETVAVRIAQPEEGAQPAVAPAPAAKHKRLEAVAPPQEPVALATVEPARSAPPVVAVVPPALPEPAAAPDDSSLINVRDD